MIGGGTKSLAIQAPFGCLVRHKNPDVLHTHTHTHTHTAAQHTHVQLHAQYAYNGSQNTAGRRAAPHVLRSDDAIIIQVRAAMPVLEAGVRGLILLAEDEVHEVLVAHLAGRLAREAAWCLLENSVHDAVREAVLAIAQQVVPVDHEIVVLVQFPELHAA